MKINQGFFNSIQPALERLTELLGKEFVVFGSAPLYLLGVVESSQPINDLDIAVKDNEMIPKDAKEVYFHNNPNQILYKILVEGIEVDIGTLWPGQEDTFPKLFEDPMEVGGVKFANLDILEKWKEVMVEQYDRDKDKKYLRKIREFKSRSITN